MFKVLRLGFVAGVGISGWVGGGIYERRRREHREHQEHIHREHRDIRDYEMLGRIPGLPLGPKVSAATAIVPAGERGVAVADIPPEPVNAPRVAQIMRFGFPGLDHVRSHADYVLSYDRRNRVPHWVFEHLTKDSIQKSEGVERSNSEFKEDTSIHEFFRAKNSDYKHSGYDRGHMAPAGNHRRNQNMCDETFYLSNMAPQVGKGFNRDKWEHLERYARKLTKLYKNVYICTGPLYLPRKEASDGKMYVKYEVIGANNVSVPTHFFKVIVGETEDHQLELEAYVLPNQVIPDETPLNNFQVPVDSVERAAGLLFFDSQRI
ncbi:nuclease C1 isoform X2 [Eurytemora carolleeae]|uniref:nuclease C1 isoform X2 n=1 Tax=Eurytemora carolleeae TaxID=1294199 RepID=UPI000C75B9D1|nr:nuclease C1 isoform X2 [Eurytemora carolleeae]|eukprot:XP_023332241.1 nuclease C1-like isoform X2 [Eurytemora affinis]